MQSLRRLVVVGAAIALLAVLVPSVSAASPPSGALHVTKECSAYAGAAGGYCTIVTSNLPAIAKDSKVIYLNALVYPVLETDIVLETPGPGSNVAFGHVHLDLATGVGLATFSGGTGSFSGFTASVVVTANADRSVWYWDGTYRFSPATLGPKDLALTKTCSSYYRCTVQTSTFDPIVQGTYINYINVLPDMSVQEATVAIKNGSATGVCDFRTPPAGAVGTCAFGSGTGRLTQFHLSVVVTANEEGSYSWAGSYWYGGN